MPRARSAARRSAAGGQGAAVQDTGRSTVEGRSPGTNSGLVYMTYRAPATTANNNMGNAKVSIDPPKLHALVSADAAIRPCTPDPSFSPPYPPIRYYKAQNISHNSNAITAR